MADRFLKRGFTDKQAKLKVVWENPQIASLCSQMPNLTILSANVAAARDQVKLSREEFESLRQYALETQADYCAGCGSICQAAVGGAVPVNEVMRCLMYHRYYGEPELARETFAGLPEAVRQRLTAVDYSRAEAGLPAKAGHRPAYAPGRGDVGLKGGGKAGACRKSPGKAQAGKSGWALENKLFWPFDHRRLPDPD